MFRWIGMDRMGKGGLQKRANIAGDERITMDIRFSFPPSPFPGPSNKEGYIGVKITRGLVLGKEDICGEGKGRGNGNRDWKGRQDKVGKNVQNGK